jgi:hypothetical protein
MPRKKKIEVGQVWIARHYENEGAYYRFLIVAEFEATICCDLDQRAGKRFIAVKWGLPVDTMFTHVFDEYGNEVDWAGSLWFTLDRRSRLKPPLFKWYCGSSDCEEYNDTDCMTIRWVGGPGKNE